MESLPPVFSCPVLDTVFLRGVGVLVAVGSMSRIRRFLLLLLTALLPFSSGRIRFLLLASDVALELGSAAAGSFFTELDVPGAGDDVTPGVLRRRLPDNKLSTKKQVKVKLGFFIVCI